MRDDFRGILYFNYRADKNAGVATPSIFRQKMTEKQPQDDGSDFSDTLLGMLWHAASAAHQEDAIIRESVCEMDSL